MAPWQGFYAILDRDDEALARALLAGGAHALQIRMKGATPREIMRVAKWLRPLTRHVGAALVINDRLDLALAAEADAVHLGQDDMALTAARQLVGTRLAIGISTHNAAQVEAACAGGASYIGFGPIFATTTKGNPDPVVGIEGLREAVGRAAASGAAVPVIAIGGIALAVLEQIALAGAAGACVISQVNGAANVQEAAQAVSDAFGRSQNQ
ncbi:MAG: thiamine phosphate synthase [Myxococcales bacterium]|nr:thiamine phosphate synthase [Myxococcales bacterium]